MTINLKDILFDEDGNLNEDFETYLKEGARGLAEKWLKEEKYEKPTMMTFGLDTYPYRAYREVADLTEFDANGLIESTKGHLYLVRSLDKKSNVPFKYSLAGTLYEAFVLIAKVSGYKYNDHSTKFNLASVNASINKDPLLNEFVVSKYNHISKRFNHYSITIVSENLEDGISPEVDEDFLDESLRLFERTESNHINELGWRSAQNSRISY